MSACSKQMAERGGIVNDTTRFSPTGFHASHPWRTDVYHRVMKRPRGTLVLVRLQPSDVADRHLSYQYPVP